MVGDARGRRIGLLVEADHDIDEQGEHEEADEGDDRQQDLVVEELHFLGDRGRRPLECDLARNRMAVIRRQGARRTQQARGTQQPEGWDGNDDEDHHGDHRPGDFEPGVVG